MELNLEESILQAQDDEFRKHADTALAYQMRMGYLEETEGWTRVTIPKLKDREHAVDITMWLHDNGFKDQVNYYRDGRTFVFERGEDATAFIMRWM